jgi:hypothetical protein
LNSYGVRYWKAPECINPGERWPEAIERALNACDTMVFKKAKELGYTPPKKGFTV